MGKASNRRLAGKKAVITGGAAGIGRATSLMFVRVLVVTEI
jgi:NAD(P)-dependent dehydrogenase (short-subunit alcohol dehydrogenase family)